MSLGGDLVASLDALDAAFDQLLDADCSAADPHLLARFERAVRRAPAVSHQMLAGMQASATPRELGATGWRDVLTTALRLSRREARERLVATANLGPRPALTGEVLAPRWEATAAAQARGDLGAEHVEIITRFHRELPGWVDDATRARVDADLAGHAAGNTPEATRELAREVMARIDQDGPEPDDVERARTRGITIGAQRRDGMSRISGELTPAARATLEAVFAKLAAPGMNVPDSDAAPGAEAEPGLNGDLSAAGEPTDDQKNSDYRTTAQRQHDALEAMGRSVLSSGELGQHKSLPATIIVTTTLQDLERGAGIARTAGGTRLPMRDVIRLAQQSYHYLAVFDEHTNKALYLGRARRCASTAQKIMLLARDRGCTRPGCTASGYHTEVHHLTPWKAGGRTDIDKLTLACPPDNRLEDQTPWTTAMNRRGESAWKPPPALDTGQARVNDYHHPERMLRRIAEDEPEEDDDACRSSDDAADEVDAHDSSDDAGRDGDDGVGEADGGGAVDDGRGQPRDGRDVRNDRDVRDDRDDRGA